MITGETSLANVVITKDLRAGLMKVDSLENSINIVGASCYTSSTNTLNENLCGAQALKLQTDLSGNVDIFDGKIVMSPNGNVDIKETVKAKKVVASEYEVSDSSESAGTSTVKAQTLRVSVNTGVVRESSKIFVTPRGNTKGESLYIESVISGESFTVAISNTIGNGLEFDWFIVGVN